MTDALLTNLQHTLFMSIGRQAVITGMRNVSGGCINHCYIISTPAAQCFVKYNSATLYPGMMQAEANGLKLLREANRIKVPEVIACGSDGALDYLVLEYLQPVAPDETFWDGFGHCMAELHIIGTHTSFGLDHDNYIGSLPQVNSWNTRWSEFFINQRLEVQLVRAFNAGLLDARHTDKFHKLYPKVTEIFPTQYPCLLHGDLWSGNFISTAEGAAIIDPAVYYGSCEMEIAYTTLFGGFDEDFYDSYKAIMPLQPGFDKRKDIYNLYPLLVHLNLFGRSYLSQIEEILKPF